MFQSKNFICSCCKTEQHDGTFLTTQNNKNWRYVCCFCIQDELTNKNNIFTEPDATIEIINKDDN